MTTDFGSPIDRLLTAFLMVAPMTYLVADVTYATQGWASPSGAVIHVAGAIAYSFVVLRLITWTRPPLLAATLLVVGMLGVAGNVAYAFNTIHVSLGDTDLVDASGAGVLIKPLGLFFPLFLLLAAVAVERSHIAPIWVAGLVGLAGVAWPIAHIGNIGWLAVAVNLVLVVALVMVAIRGRGADVASAADSTVGR